MYIASRSVPSAPKTIRALIAGGAAVDARNRTGQTALMIAAEMGATGSAQELVRRGASVNARDWRGRTARSYAAEGGEMQIAILLERAGAIE